MDLVSRTDRIPSPGETINGTAFEMHSGGKGANQAVAVARLGHPSILLGATGDDLFGHQLQSTLNESGVDTSHINIVHGSSGVASITVDSSGENTIIVVPGANLKVTPAYLSTKLDVIKEAAMVLAQLEIPLETIEWLANVCADHGVPLMLDPAPARRLPLSLLRNVTWFTPNQTETSFYWTEGDTTEQNLSCLFEMGIANIILKQGSEGAVIAAADGTREQVAAFPVNAIDTTAAGDAFNGAFAVGLARGNSIKASAQFAAAAAAISVTRRGAQSSLPNEDEVAAFLKTNALPR